MNQWYSKSAEWCNRSLIVSIRNAYAILWSTIRFVLEKFLFGWATSILCAADFEYMLQTFVGNTNSYANFNKLKHWIDGNLFEMKMFLTIVYCGIQQGFMLGNLARWVICSSKRQCNQYPSDLRILLLHCIGMMLSMLPMMKEYKYIK